MQNVSCPSCGAQVAFRSHASVMAVCEFCKTTILKDADSVKDIGRMSDVLQDYSPIQIGTSGVQDGRAFTVIGRIQLRYPAGIWNEWYLYTEDGRESWLSDASGLYTLTTAQTPPADSTGLPEFTALTPAHAYVIAAEQYVASDIRTADCIGGQGELPFSVHQGWQARVADFRRGSKFVTLDYSDAGPPKIYAGVAVALDQLNCQLLREDDVIQASAGKFDGKVAPLNCPSCGTSVSYVPGLTTHLLCPSCHAEVDTSGVVAQVLAAGERVKAVSTTLELGARGAIAGKQYEIIGLMLRRDDEGSKWTEYLLHSERAGFLWLVETEDGWSRSQAREDWPVWDLGDTAAIGNRAFRKLYEYDAEVVFAAGAFNWKVVTGDKVKVVEFENRQDRLAAEMTAEEITWSFSSPVPDDQIKAWFGASIKPGNGKPLEKRKLGATAKVFIWIILILNAIPMLFSFKTSWLFTALGLAAVYLPAKFIDTFGGDKK
ncbi:DUF4178 domain-containing protein [Herbaspirillum autotrophicum]|uniref:DUF4178 domain-containing protein n=1 Tax=Herbaspirillum autotrophicum TaxID=180195 RepID=UPI00067AA4B3|nr:DUF4178 domain-containing protein [Herbaspirillum autotrophicum]